MMIVFSLWHKASQAFFLDKNSSSRIPYSGSQWPFPPPTKKVLCKKPFFIDVLKCSMGGASRSLACWMPLAGIWLLALPSLCNICGETAVLRERPGKTLVGSLALTSFAVAVFPSSRASRRRSCVSCCDATCKIMHVVVVDAPSFSVNVNSIHRSVISSAIRFSGRRGKEERRQTPVERNVCYQLLTLVRRFPGREQILNERGNLMARYMPSMIGLLGTTMLHNKLLLILCVRYAT